MIARTHSTIRRGAPVAVAALLLLAGCAAEGDDEEGQATAEVVDAGGDTTTTTEEVTDDSTDDGDDAGADDDGSAEDDDGAAEEDDPYGGEDPYDTGGLTNECPAEGCLVRIIGMEPNGGEVNITFDANFAPDTGGNHFHIYWNNWDPAEVSADTGVGVWAARAEYPVYDTGLDGNTSTGSSARGGTDEICVTPANSGHVVIDPEIYDCWSVDGYEG